MKGLVLKDMYSIRFVVIASLLMSLFPSFLLIMFDITADAEGGDFVRTVVSYLVFGIVNYITLMLFPSCGVSSIALDKKCGFDRYQATMPVTPAQLMAGKQISSGIVVGIFVLLCIGVNLTGLQYGLSPEVLIVMPVSIGLLELASVQVSLYVVLRFGERILSLVQLVIMIAGAGFLCLIFLLMEKVQHMDIVLRIVCYGVMPLLAAAAIVFFGRAGRKLFNNEE